MGKKCKLVIEEPLPFQEFEGGQRVPASPLAIYRAGMETPLITQAIIDTGCDYDLILSRQTAQQLEKLGEPDGYTSLNAGVEIPASLFNIFVKTFGRWRNVEALAPVEGQFEDLIGRPLMKGLNICLRFEPQTTHIATRPLNR